MRWGFALGAAVVLLLVGVSTIATHRTAQQFPPIGEFIDVDGTRLHYTDQGTGIPIVLVHGANSNLLEFQTSLVPILAKTHRVLVFDRPGYGYSERPSGDWLHPGDIARLLIDACDMLGAKQPVVVGHSWAGSVVMSALLREPQRVAGGVLLAGAAGHWVGERSLPEQIGDWPALNALFARTLLYPIGQLLTPDALAAVFAPQPVPAGHARRVGAALALRPGSYQHNTEDMNRLSVFLQAESTRYREIQGRLLAIHGTHDELVPYWNHGQRLEAVIPNFEAELLQGDGHALHHVNAARVSTLIQTFADSL